MMRKMVMRGLPVLLAAALLGACATSTPQVRATPTVRSMSVGDPCNLCGVPCVLPEESLNTCDWAYTCGDACDAPNAAQMLSGIRHWAMVSRVRHADSIKDLPLGRIKCRVPECQLSTLSDKEGVHVCVCQPTEVSPCQELVGIYGRAREAYDLVVLVADAVDAGNPIPDPEWVEANLADARGRWHTVATDLDNFPSRVPVIQGPP